MTISVVILCAGKGSRLLPHTSEKPKAMVELLGKPIIKWIHESIQNLDLGYIYVVSGYRYNVIEPYVKTFLDKDVRFARQKYRTGTADAINLLNGMIKDDFIVLAGDTIFNLKDLEKLRLHPNSLLYTEQKDRLYEFGSLDMDGCYIKHINEKSTTPTSNNVNCSAYHFTSDIFKYISKTEIDKRFDERIITNTINLMIDDGYSFKGIKIDELNEVSYPKDIKIVEERLKELK